MRKNTFWRSVLVGAVGVFAACSGDPGPQGPPGAAGTPGTGEAGAPGTATLTKTSKEPPGANCANGGTKIEVGPDTNGNGVLDPNEVVGSATTYVCNGSGTNSLVKASNEPPGTHCAYGGVKIESGIDANNNGILDPNEINQAATTYACNAAPGGSVAPSSGINVVIAQGAVSTATTGPITVRFQLKDDRGFPVDINGKFSQNLVIQPRFAIAYFTKDGTGRVSPLTVYTQSASAAAPTVYQPTMYNPVTTGQGTLTENGMGAGDYTYAFPTADTPNGAKAVQYDTTKVGETHVVWIQATRQTDDVFPTNANTFSAANQDYYFIPNGAGTVATRQIVDPANCSKCHDKFKPETTTTNAFHGGGRVNAMMCNVCHNPGRTSNPAANSSVFVHRIHRGEHLQTANQFHGIAATYPQDIRNCDTCHKNAAQGAQSQTNPSRAACGSCHDYVKFDGSAPITCAVPSAYDANGAGITCNHLVGTQADDSQCATCHTPTTLAQKHIPVVPPDPNNSLSNPTTGTAYTNASYVAATSYVPTNAVAITYDIKSVDAWTDTGVTPNVKRPSITFKLKANGTDVVFQTYAAGTVTELMPNFVGSPSVYFAFAMPQDGETTPADFNVSFGAYIKNVWNGTAAGAGAGTLTGPDSNGYYLLKMTGVVVPAAATMLTGGLGYTYAVNGTPPLVQTNVAEYPYNTTTKVGGLSVPAPNVWKVATGYTGRRTIVATANCNNCHAGLGVAPNFHAGQRNDGPTCSFCHTANRTSSGWPAGSRYFIHAIHAARKRTVDYTWHATQAGAGFGDVEFPGQLNYCKTCHLPNAYDFTGTDAANAVDNLTPTTVATGKYDGSSVTNPNNYYTLSPYVVADNTTDYGTGYAYNAVTGVATEATGATLVISPITTVCSACHDSPTAIAHFRQNGGSYYVPRSTYLAPNAPKEECLICHGPGRVAAVGQVHLH